MQWIVPEKKLHKFLTDTLTEGRTHKQTKNLLRSGRIDVTKARHIIFKV